MSARPPFLAADRDLTDVVYARGHAATATRISASGSGAMFPGMPAETPELLAEGDHGDTAGRARR